MIVGGNGSASCVPAGGTGCGQVVIMAKARIDLSRAESYQLIEKRFSGSLFIVAHWDHDEPVIHGEGDTASAALLDAQENIRGLPRYRDVELLVHQRVPGERGVWRCCRTGRVVTIEHFRTLDN